MEYKDSIIGTERGSLGHTTRITPMGITNGIYKSFTVI
jgi:hypothetical protein